MQVIKLKQTSSKLNQEIIYFLCKIPILFLVTIFYIRWYFKIENNKPSKT